MRLGDIAVACLLDLGVSHDCKPFYSCFSDKNDTDGEVKFWKKNWNGDDSDEELDPTKMEPIKQEPTVSPLSATKLEPTVSSKQEPIVPTLSSIPILSTNIKPDLKPKIETGNDGDFKVPMEKIAVGLKKEVVLCDSCIYNYQGNCIEITISQYSRIFLYSPIFLYSLVE